MRRLIPIAALATACVSEPGDADTDASSSTSDASTAVAESSSTGQSETGRTAGPITDTETETTGPASETDTIGPTGCQRPSDCSDPSRPFCIDEVCVACSFAAAPDMACAAADREAPLCVNDECVQCSAEDATACSEITPLCDAEANACVACEFHEQCQDIGSPACNFVTGACFDAAAAIEVDGTTAGSIQAAIDGVADGAERAIVLTDGGGLHTVAIDGGKTIAIVSSNTSIREIRGGGDGPGIAISGRGTTVSLHRVWMSINQQGVGVSVEDEAHLYADSSRITPLFSHGGITLAAGTTGQLRNCMVGGSTVDVSAVLVNGGNLDAIYTSILGGALDSYGLRCTSGSATVRNSIVTTRGDNDALVCPGASVPNSAVENNGNPDWFSNYNAGDAHLTAAGQAQFTNIAIWEDGDPPFDFESHARPAIDGSADFPGADTIP